MADKLQGSGLIEVESLFLNSERKENYYTRKTILNKVPV